MNARTASATSCTAIADSSRPAIRVTSSTPDSRITRRIGSEKRIASHSETCTSTTPRATATKVATESTCSTNSIVATIAPGPAIIGVNFSADAHPLPERASGGAVWNNVAGAVDFYLAHGVPANRIVVGVPFYGRGYRVTSDANDGLYQPYGGTYAAGDWRTIKAKYLEDPAWQRHWHPVAESPWLFNPKEHVFISYEDPRSIAIRAEFARDRGLRGVFTWELAGDDDQGSLLEAMAKPFK